MTYRIEFTTAAAKQIRKLDPPIRRKLLTAVAALADEPRPVSARKLVGQDTAWRIRVGDYRIVYDVFDTELLVTVVRAAHRREVYDR